MKREIFIRSLKKDLIGSFLDERSVLKWKDIHVSARYKGKQYCSALANLDLWLVYIQPVILIGDETAIVNLSSTIFRHLCMFWTLD